VGLCRISKDLLLTAYRNPSRTIGPFTADTTAKIYLTDNTCRDTYFSDGTPFNHVEITSQGPSGPDTLNFADSGGYCERSGKGAGSFTGYNFTVTIGAESGAPGTPGRPTAVDGNHQATVSVTAPTSGGTPASYTVTASDTTTPGHGGQTCGRGSAGVCTLWLTNGDSYTFTATPGISPLSRSLTGISGTGPACGWRWIG
jgi:hypothetical protein